MPADPESHFAYPNNSPYCAYRCPFGRKGEARLTVRVDFGSERALDPDKMPQPRPTVLVQKQVLLAQERGGHE